MLSQTANQTSVSYIPFSPYGSFSCLPPFTVPSASILRWYPPFRLYSRVSVRGSCLLRSRDAGPNGSTVTSPSDILHTLWGLDESEWSPGVCNDRADPPRSPSVSPGLCLRHERKQEVEDNAAFMVITGNILLPSPPLSLSPSLCFSLSLCQPFKVLMKWWNPAGNQTWTEAKQRNVTKLVFRLNIT